MLFALFITVFSFKVLKSNQGQLEETSKSVIIQNSNFQSRQFSNANNLHKSNKFTNAKISNSNFKFKGSKDHALVLQLVDFSNDTIELDEDFESSPIELGSGKSSIFNLTLKNINYKDNSLGIFSFDSTDIELTQLKCKGKLMSTLFKGPVTGFSLKDSTIEGFAKDDTHKIRAAIFLSHITCTDSSKRFDFINNKFINNQIQVFELDKAIDNNVLIQKSTFQKNKASSGSCILISSKSGARITGVIDIDGNNFTENENSGDSGIVGGALKINTQQAKFTGDNYFSKNDCFYDGSSSSSEASGAYGGSIFITQTRLSPITLTGLHFEGDASSHAGGAIFVYGYDEGGQTELNSVTISGCTFTKCHSDQFGGGFATGIEKSNGDVVGNNDVKISGCTFEECSAGTGGSIYVALGSAKGGESTAIEDCTFKKCTASKASAIYSGSIEFTMKGSTFTNQGEEDKVSNSNMILLSLKDAGGKANIEGCTFDSCYHAVLGASEDSDKSNIITFEGCKFTNNKITSERGSFRGVFDLSYIKSVSLNLVSCNFTINDGFCIIAEKGICKTTINNCLFQNNGGSYGCIIYITKDSATDSQEYITFIDSQFIDHSYTVVDTGRANGVIHIPLNFVAFDGTNTFMRNSAIFNGKGTSKGNSAIGGSIFFECSTDKNVYLSNLVFDDSTSTNYGGAIAFLYEPSGSAQLKLSLTLQNCKFTKCEAKTGGAIYIDNNDRAQYEIFINRCTFNKCDADYGSSLYCQASKFEISYSIFEEMSKEGNIPNSDGTEETPPTLIYVDLTQSSENKVTNCTFNKINEIMDIRSTSSSSSITFTKCSYTHNCEGEVLNKVIIILDSIQCNEINFNECTFTENAGVCFFQEADITHNVNIKKCLFNKNNGMGGSAISALTSDKIHKIIVEDCEFSYNYASLPSLAGYCFGAVIAYSNSIEFKGTNTFNHNEVYSEGESDVSEVGSAYGGSLAIIQNDPEEYIVSNLNIMNSYSQHFAGGIVIFAGDFQSSDQKKSAFVQVKNCIFNNCSSGKQGGAIRCGIERKEGEEEENQYDNDVNISNCQFIKCKSVEGGALYFQDGDKEGDEETIVRYCTFDRCEGSKGSAIACSSYKFDLAYSTFRNSKKHPEDISETQSVLYINHNEGGISPVILNCSFDNNLQGFELYASGIMGEDENHITFKHCNFTNNNKEEYSMDPFINLEFIAANLITFDECLFDGNNGPCIQQESDLVNPTVVKKCTFTNNAGQYGTCIRTARSIIKDQYLSIEDCIFSHNRATYRGGALEINTFTVQFYGINQFIDNNVDYISEDPESSEISRGGAIYLTQDEPSEYKFSNFIFTGCSATGEGGAVLIYAGDIENKDESYSKDLFITFENCTFSGCSAGIRGGAIRLGRQDTTHDGDETFDNDINLSNCEFSQCSSLNGGALYLPDGDEKGDEVTIVRYCIFNGCEGHTGSSIFCRSYKFQLAHTIICNSNPYQGSDEGEGSTNSFLYVYHDEGGIDSVIENCSFTNNEQGIEFISKESGGDISPQANDNSITFLKCNFTKNNQQFQSAEGFLDLSYIESGNQVIFEECLLEENNGPCFYQEGTYSHPTLIKKCIFTNNRVGKEGESSGQASCIVAHSTEFTNGCYITVENCIFSNNSATSIYQARGVIWASTGAIHFSGVNQFINNSVKRGYDDPYDPSSSLGGSLFIYQEDPAEYKLSNCIFVNSYSDGVGGAIQIYAGDLEDQDDSSISKNLFITIENCTFTNCTSVIKGGAIMCGKEDFTSTSADNDMKIRHCTFTQCKSAEGGALYFRDGDSAGDEETIIEYCTFNSCSGSRGSAFSCYSYKFTLSHSIFHGSRIGGNQDEEEESFIFILQNEAGIAPVVTNCTFEDNEQDIIFMVNSQNAGEESVNQITFKRCNFHKNNQDMTSESILNLDYIQSSLVKFDSCMFEENGGKCIKQEGEEFTNTHIYNCTFNKNYGFPGCAISSRQRSYKGDKVIVENCHFTNNKPTQSDSNFYYGAVVAFSNAIDFQGTNRFENNEVYSIEGAESELQMAFGGSLVILQNPYEPEDYTVSNLIFINSYSQHFGGAIAIFAGDFEEGGSGTKNSFVKIVNCKFTNCSSGKQGGAIRCGIELSEEEDGEYRPQFDNDVNISHCQFTKCKAPEGTLYFQDGDKEGDEETIIEYCTFEGCIGSKGSCILCLSYKFELSHSTFRGSRQTGDTVEEDTVESFLYSWQNEGGIVVTVTDCIFEDNEQNIEMESAGFSTDETEVKSTITFKDCKFLRNNRETQGPNSIIDLKFIESELVEFDGCLFEGSGGACIKQDDIIFTDTRISKCVFNKNYGSAGCAICSLSHSYGDKKIVVEDCNFTNNKPTQPANGYYGAVIAYSKVIEFKGTNKFENNEVHSTKDAQDEAQMAFGGSLVIFQDPDQPEEYTVRGIKFINSYSQHFGGAIAIFAGDFKEGGSGAKSSFVTIENCQFTNCSSGKQGGAIRCGLESEGRNDYDNDVKISHCQFTKCKAPEGTLYFQEGDKDGDEETVIEYCTFEGCIGSKGSCILCKSYKFELSHSIFRGSRQVGKVAEGTEVESFLYSRQDEAGIAPVVTNCTFEDNEQNIEFYSYGAAIEGDADSEITFKDCKFLKNNIESNGADTILDLNYILSSKITFEGCLFEENAGRCISQDSETLCSTHVKGCTFNKNHGGSGCALFLSHGESSTTDLYMTVEDCTFSNNKASFYDLARGIIMADTLAIRFEGVNKFIDNEVRHESEDTSNSMGGSLFLTQREPAAYEIKNLEFTNSYSDGYGGAIHIFAGDVESKDDPKPTSLFITIKDCKFDSCRADIQGGAIRMGDPKARPEDTKDNDINISFCEFVNCEALEGGALYFMDGDMEGDEETVVEYSKFDKCKGATGSAIYCQSYKFQLAHTTFQDSKPYGKTSEMSEIESVLFVYLNEAGIEPVIKNCTFINNEQNIEVQSHGPIAGEGLVSSVKFLESHFIMNNQESNGADTILDLQHIQSQYVTFEKCDFKENAGYCLKQDTEWVCNTNVTYCTFEKNHGGAGCAIFAVSSRSDNLPLMTIDNCAFIENTVKSSWGARGGAVQVSTLAAKFTGVNRFDGNQAKYEDEMGRSIPSFWQAAAGGALYIIQETDLKFELRDAVFTGCSSDHYGGAVVLSCLEDEDLFSKLFIDIINCEFAGCTAARGGAICSTIEGTIKIEECKFFSDSAEDGGSIYVTDDTTDTPSTIDITKCFFDKSTSTNSGGAIYCKSGSIIAAANNFTNCQSDSKGAVMYLSAHSSTTLGNNYIEMNKKQGVSAIYYSSTNPQSILWMDGGCYSSTKSGHDTSADILVFESTGKIEFRNKPCFSGTKEESIQIIGNQALDLPGEYFNCHECEPIVVPPSPSFSIPPSYVPPSSGESSFNPSGTGSGSGGNDGNSGKGGKKSKLSTGAIIGIVIAIVVVVAVIVVLVVLLMRSRVNKNDVRSEQISQDADNSAYALESRVSTNEDENQPIWAANSMDANNVQENVDPFMKDFEEAVV